jgi:DHA3 family macrolide efflux protein-like MFS transporter
MGDTRGARLLTRDFLFLWQGHVVSQLGSHASHVALVLLVLERTDSPGLVSALLALSAVPAVVVGPVAGPIGDRFSRRSVLVASDVVRGVAMLALAASAVVIRDPRVFVAVAAAMALVSGSVGAVFSPALMAGLADITPREKLDSANALTQGASQLCTVAGQAVGGIAYSCIGAAALFGLDGATFLISAAFASRVRLASGTAAAGMGLRAAWRQHTASLGEGWSVTLRFGGHRLLAAVATVNFAFMPVFALLPVYVRDVLGARPEWYGFCLAAAATGSLAGLALAAARGGRSAPPSTAPLVLVGGATILLAAWPSRACALACFVALGAGAGFFNVRVLTRFQAMVPPDRRATAVALLVAASSAAAPLGLLLGGVLGELALESVRWIVAVCGLAILLTAVASLERAGSRSDA